MFTVSIEKVPASSQPFGPEIPANGPNQVRKVGPLWALRRKKNPSTKTLCSTLFQLFSVFLTLAVGGPHLDAQIAKSQSSESPPKSPLHLFPDPPILAFFDFLAFFVFRFPLLFNAFFLSFPRNLGVPRRERPLHFSGFPLLFFFFCKEARVGGSGLKTRAGIGAEIAVIRNCCNLKSLVGWI